MKKPIFASFFLLILAGCSTNTTFVYKPGAPAVGAQKLPVKVAVLPFKDGTEDFLKRGSALDAESLTFNLAKSGIAGFTNALPPVFWAKAFSADMAASGNFRTVHFIFSPTELLDEEFYFAGTLEKANAAGGWTKPSEFVLNLQGVRRSDKRTIWEKRIVRDVIARKSDFDGCGNNFQCMADRSHASMNETMQGMFAEARVDFLRSQDYIVTGRDGQDLVREGPTPPLDSESVDEVVKKILNGQ